jgi:hypothetical protein
MVALLASGVSLDTVGDSALRQIHLTEALSFTGVQRESVMLIVTPTE